jgi:hypothetical protein
VEEKEKERKVKGRKDGRGRIEWRGECEVQGFCNPGVALSSVALPYVSPSEGASKDVALQVSPLQV